MAVLVMIAITCQSFFDTRVTLLGLIIAFFKIMFQSIGSYHAQTFQSCRTQKSAPPHIITQNAHRCRVHNQTAFTCTIIVGYRKVLCPKNISMPSMSLLLEDHSRLQLIRYGRAGYRLQISWRCVSRVTE